MVKMGDSFVGGFELIIGRYHSKILITINRNRRKGKRGGLRRLAFTTEGAWRTLLQNLSHFYFDTLRALWIADFDSLQPGYLVPFCIYNIN